MKLLPCIIPLFLSLLSIIADAAKIGEKRSKARKTSGQKPNVWVEQAKSQVGELAKYLKTTPLTEHQFTENSHPVLFLKEHSSNFVEMLHREFPNGLDKDLTKEARRKLIQDFPLLRSVRHQIRAIRIFPNCTNMHTRKKFLVWALNNLPLYADRRNWYRVMRKTQKYPKLRDRVTAIFKSEDEEDLRGQYCSYAALKEDEKVQVLGYLPVIRLQRRFDCTGFGERPVEEGVEEEDVTDIELESDGDGWSSASSEGTESDREGDISIWDSSSGSDAEEEKVVKIEVRPARSLLSTPSAKHNYRSLNRKGKKVTFAGTSDPNQPLTLVRKYKREQWSDEKTNEDYEDDYDCSKDTALRATQEEDSPSEPEALEPIVIKMTGDDDKEKKQAIGSDDEYEFVFEEGDDYEQGQATPPFEDNYVDRSDSSSGEEEREHVDGDKDGSQSSCNIDGDEASKHSEDSDEAHNVIHLPQRVSEAEPQNDHGSRFGHEQKTKKHVASSAFDLFLHNQTKAQLAKTSTAAIIEGNKVSRTAPPANKRMIVLSDTTNRRSVRGEDGKVYPVVIQVLLTKTLPDPDLYPGSAPKAPVITIERFDLDE